jgi:DegV family protein with EDD domain
MKVDSPTTSSSSRLNNMSSVCIITDSAAQFPQMTFNGRNLVRMIPQISQINGAAYTQGEDFKASSLPLSASETLHPRLIASPAAEFEQVFADLAARFHLIIGVFTSSKLNDSYTNAVEAASNVRGKVDIEIIDSQTTSVGLGFLVETAAEAAFRGKSGTEVEELVRSLIPRIYSVLCTPSLSYLYYNSFVDRGQAAISEMLGLYPMFAIEEGKLTPLEKLRNQRQVLSYFQEFMDEFDRVQHIALLQNLPPTPQDALFLREHAHENFPKTPFTTHPINLPLATLFGPRTLGLFVVENSD